MRNSILRAVVLGAMSMASLSGPVLAAQREIVNVPAQVGKGKRGLFNDVVLPQSQSLWGRKGARISMAQQKRASIKKHNVARNRKAGRK